MVKRILQLSNENSFFLFGARGTGKSTLLSTLPFLKQAHKIDLLKPSVEDAYRLDPELLEKEALALPPGSWVLIDEVQKIPRLLDSVHSLIESHKIKFAMTGSSSRKLKRAGANLMAGRAFTYHLYPFSELELGKKFSLESALRWGSLPQVTNLDSDSNKRKYLDSYVYTYLKEEIQIEQLVRNIDPFRLFLPIAAQMNGEIINYSNISKDTGVSYKTVETYFQILQETLLGFLLLPYSKSVRKVQKQSPKFYFIDQGIKRALEKKLSLPVSPGTSEYGNAFESWFISECQMRNDYLQKDYQFSYLRTKDDVEIDLVIQKPNGQEVLVEIKSTDKILDKHLRSLKGFENDFPKAELICVANIKQEQKVGRIRILPWQKAFRVLGLES